ncbi:hypothetical protein TVAG_253960 [Trichomonas vaginalis G3]|uniref:Uncharacterized protein n=1 Tax=Trichomonas vaginalis (strain ATCC PRA-98 / G3) TaxID=412133 RepID=A2DMR3_TRIV3|nr:hypothetical protein TVAG_253960 [Trichomonas vaginalis G3]|eukprot:XP_001579270.1 hypothetical protein [Trichomonas vaginalis G3]
MQGLDKDIYSYGVYEGEKINIACIQHPLAIVIGHELGHCWGVFQWIEFNYPRLNTISISIMTRVFKEVGKTEYVNLFERFYKVINDKLYELINYRVESDGYGFFDKLQEEIVDAIYAKIAQKCNPFPKDTISNFIWQFDEITAFSMLHDENLNYSWRQKRYIKNLLLSVGKVVQSAKYVHDAWNNDSFDDVRNILEKDITYKENGVQKVIKVSESIALQEFVALNPGVIEVYWIKDGHS